MVLAPYTDQDIVEVSFAFKTGGCAEKSSTTGRSVELSVGTITLTVPVVEPLALVAVNV